jgi:uncharacterized protein (DUF1778 family)
MATARMDLRLDKKLKEKVEKASALTGAKSMTDYVISIMEKEATKDINRYESMTVKNDIFDRFMDACEKAGKPDKALSDAAEFTKKQGIK